MNKNLKRLLVISALDAITDIYMYIFLNARLYELADNAISIIAVFYIIEYTFLILSIIFFSNKFKSKSVKSLRLGIFLNLLLITIIILIGDKLVKYYCIIAIIMGISQGAYYAPLNVLTGAHNDIPVKYCTISSIVYFCISIIFPITIGAYITVTSFTSVTVCMCAVAIIQIILSFGIDNVESKESCDIKGFIKYIKRYNCGKEITRFYKIHFLKGIVTSVLDRTVVILIMILYGSSFELGALSTVFSVCTVIAVAFINKFYSKKSTRIILIISAIVPMVALVLLVLYTSKTTFIIYKAINAIFISMLNILSSINKFSCITKSANKKYVTEHQILSEVALAAGRVFGLICLLGISILDEEMLGIKIMLCFVGVAIVLYAYNIKQNLVKNT